MVGIGKASANRRSHLAGAGQAQRDAEDALFAGLADQQRDQLRNLLIAPA
jgi:hypothetical protein